MSRYELHLEGCRGPVLWNAPEADGDKWTNPPRVVIYGETVWHFYRFKAATIPDYLGATYRKATALFLAPGEYIENARGVPSTDESEAGRGATVTPIRGGRPQE